MARPTKYKKEYCEMLIEHMRKGYSFETFGAVIDVSKVTLYSWQKQFPEFMNAVDRKVEKKSIENWASFIAHTCFEEHQ